MTSERFVEVIESCREPGEPGSFYGSAKQGESELLSFVYQDRLEVTTLNAPACGACVQLKLSCEAFEDQPAAELRLMFHADRVRPLVAALRRALKSFPEDQS